MNILLLLIIDKFFYHWCNTPAIMKKHVINIINIVKNESYGISVEARQLIQDSLTHWFTHSLTHSFTHSLIHSLTHTAYLFTYVKQSHSYLNVLFSLPICLPTWIFVCLPSWLCICLLDCIYVCLSACMSLCVNRSFTNYLDLNILFMVLTTSFMEMSLNLLI